MKSLSFWIDRYVDSLKADKWIDSSAVEAAFRRVPRHKLIEKVYQGRLDWPSVTQIDASNPDHMALIYSDRRLYIHWPELSISSQPGLMAMQLEYLALQPGMRVLEMGAGSGYNAALMAEMVSESGSVTTIDIQEDLVAQTARRLSRAGYERIHVLAKDGFYGCPDDAPYDRIVSTVGFLLLSPHWVEQLAEDGMLLIPLAHGGLSNCPLVRIEKKEGRLLGKVVAYANFMAARGDSEVNLFPSDRKKKQFKPIIKSSLPSHEYALPEGLKQIPNPTPRPGKGAALLEFLYFLALHTPNTFLAGHRIGVGTPAGFVLISQQGIMLYGPQAATVYEELTHVYQKWIALARPRMLDYQLEFVPITEQNKEKPALPANTWAIDRKQYRQIVRL